MPSLVSCWSHNELLLLNETVSMYSRSTVHSFSLLNWKGKSGFNGDCCDWKHWGRPKVKCYILSAILKERIAENERSKIRAIYCSLPHILVVVAKNITFWMFVIMHFCKEDNYRTCTFHNYDGKMASNDLGDVSVFAFLLEVGKRKYIFAQTFWAIKLNYKSLICYAL